MTLLYLDGFDAQDFTLRWVGTTTSYAVNAATPFTIGFCLQGTQASSTVLKRSFTAAAQAFVGLQFAYNSSAQQLLALWGDSGATQHLTITASGATGVISLFRGSNGGTLLAQSGPGALPGDGNYRFLEISATISATVGTVEVRVQGATVLTFTGNTKNAGTNSTIDAVGIFNPSGSTSSAIWHRYDDLYICNALGSANNTFLGQMRVQTLSPNAAGADSGLTIVGSANHYANVSDNSNATYNFSSVATTRDTYNIPDLAAATSAVLGTQLTIRAVNSDAGAGAFKPVYRSGTTNFYDATDTLGASILDYVGAVRETDPNTSAAWTVSGVNALQIGAEVA